jgi:two-component system cell cycle response regulator
MQGIQIFDTIDLPGSSNEVWQHEAIAILWVDEAHRKSAHAETSIIQQIHSKITHVVSIQEAMDRLEASAFDLVLSGFRLADGTAVELLNEMMQHNYDIPLIIVTPKGDERIATQVLQAGAYDYIALNHLGRKEWIQCINKALNKAHIKKEARKAIQKMAELSTRDGLTGLYNRRYFSEALEREVARSGRRGSDLILCMFDIDHFKNINDTLGHQAGDMVLTEFGRMLGEWLRLTDIPCRYGGEEFAVILADTTKEQTFNVCERFRNALADHVFEYENQRFHITVSAGVASILDIAPPKTGDRLISASDQALYSAKHTGRNRIVLYDANMEEQAHAVP